MTTKRPFRKSKRKAKPRDLCARRGCTRKRAEFDQFCEACAVEFVTRYRLPDYRVRRVTVIPGTVLSIIEPESA